MKKLLFILSITIFSIMIFTYHKTLAAGGYGDNSYIDVQCGGDCPYATVTNNTHAGVDIAPSIIVSNVSIKTEDNFKVGTKATIGWDTYATGETGYAAYDGYEINYSLNNGSDYQGVQCLNPRGTIPPALCLDFVHPIYFPNRLYDYYADYSSPTYDKKVLDHKEYSFNIPKGWIGKTIKFQIIEKFYQGASRTFDYTMLWISSYSNNIGISVNFNTTIPDLEITGQDVCYINAQQPLMYFEGSSLNSIWYNTYDPDAYTTYHCADGRPYNNGLTIFGQPPCDRIADWDINDYWHPLSYDIHLLINGQEYSNDIYGKYIKYTGYIYNDNYNYYDKSYTYSLFDGDSSYNNSIIKPGDTVQYRLDFYYNSSYCASEYNGWSCIKNLKKYIGRSIYSEAYTSKILPCFADSIKIDPSSSILNPNTGYESQQFTAKAHYLSAPYRVDGGGNIVSTPRIPQPETQDVTNITDNSSGFNYYIYPNGAENSLTKWTTLNGPQISLKQPYPTETVYGHIGYNYNYLPPNLFLGNINGYIHKDLYSQEDINNRLKIWWPSASAHVQINQEQKLDVEVHLKANDSEENLTINPGESVKLTWTSKNATTCNASSSWLDWSGFKELNNQTGEIVNPPNSSIYTLWCWNDWDFKYDEIMVNINQPQSSGLKIMYDSNIINNPPPGFSDLIAPNWLEKVP